MRSRRKEVARLTHFAYYYHLYGRDGDGVASSELGRLAKLNWLPLVASINTINDDIVIIFVCVCVCLSQYISHEATKKTPN